MTIGNWLSCFASMSAREDTTEVATCTFLVGGGDHLSDHFPHSASQSLKEIRIPGVLDTLRVKHDRLNM